MEIGDFLKRIQPRFHCVAPERAVDVEVNKPRRKKTAAQVEHIIAAFGRGFGVLGDFMNLPIPHAQRAPLNFIRQNEPCVGKFHGRMMGSAAGVRQWFWDESGEVEVAPPVRTGFKAHTMRMVTAEAAAVFQP